MKLAEIRAQYPQYDEVPDDVLVGKLREKFYPDMDQADFNSRVGYQPEPEPQPLAAALEQEAPPPAPPRLPASLRGAQPGVDAALEQGRNEGIIRTQAPEMDYDPFFETVENVAADRLPHLGRGIVERGAHLVGSTADAISDGIRNNVRDTGVASGIAAAVLGDNFTPVLNAVTGELDAVGQRMGEIDIYEPTFTPDTVKESYAQGDVLGTLGQVLGFGGEQFITSLPDMVATLTNLPAYVVSRAGEIASERAQELGLAMPSSTEYNYSTVASMLSAMLEKFGAEKVFGGSVVGETLAKTIGRGAASEAVTEAGQESLEYAGAKANTGNFDVAEMGENAFWGAIGGGVGGGGMSAVQGGVDRLAWSSDDLGTLGTMSNQFDALNNQLAEATAAGDAKLAKQTQKEIDRLIAVGRRRFVTGPRGGAVDLPDETIEDAVPEGQIPLEGTGQIDDNSGQQQEPPPGSAPTESGAEVPPPAVTPGPAGESPPQSVSSTLPDPKPGTVSTARGNQVGVEFDIVEAADLVTSDGENYPSELQPRQRDRASSDAQIAEIAANLDPARLGDSPEADRGAPIIGPDGVVESGNGRVAAIRRALAEDGEAADQYRQMVEEFTGIDVSDMNDPVLIRRRTTEMTPEERQAFTVEANEQATMQMTDSERANADASLLGSVVQLANPGDMSSPANTEFVRAFIEQVSPSDRGQFLDASGNLSQSGIRRIEAAMLASAYGGSDTANSTINRILESTDDNVRSVTGAIMDVAPVFAQLRQEGLHPDYDISENIVNAIETVSDLRQQGQGVNEYLDQIDMLGDRDIVTDELIRAMYNPEMSRAAGRDRISSILRYYAEEVAREQGGQTSLLMNEDTVTAEEYLREGKNRAWQGEGQATQQTSLFQNSPPDPGDAPDGNGEQGQGSDGSSESPGGAVSNSGAGSDSGTRGSGSPESGTTEGGSETQAPELTSVPDKVWNALEQAATDDVRGKFQIDDDVYVRWDGETTDADDKIVSEMENPQIITITDKNTGTEYSFATEKKYKFTNRAVEFKNTEPTPESEIPPETAPKDAMTYLHNQAKQAYEDGRDTRAFSEQTKYRGDYVQVEVSSNSKGQKRTRFFLNQEPISRKKIEEYFEEKGNEVRGQEPESTPGEPEGEGQTPANEEETQGAEGEQDALTLVEDPETHRQAREKLNEMEKAAEEALRGTHIMERLDPVLWNFSYSLDEIERGRTDVSIDQSDASYLFEYYGDPDGFYEKMMDFLDEIPEYIAREKGRDHDETYWASYGPRDDSKGKWAFTDIGGRGTTYQSVCEDIDVPAEYKQSTDWENELFSNDAKPLSLHKKPNHPDVVTYDQATEIIGKWKKHTSNQDGQVGFDGKTNKQKTVIFLFEESGVASQPWVDAGFTVYSWDAKNGIDISDIDVDVLYSSIANEDHVWGVFAFPPCTVLSSAANARTFEEADADGRTEAAKALVYDTLDIIEKTRPAYWFIENPRGSRIGESMDPTKRNPDQSKWSVTGLKKPTLNYSHFHFGDDFNKPTSLWGPFNRDLPTASLGSSKNGTANTPGGKSRKAKQARSKFPEGFSTAFFMANNFHDNPKDALHWYFPFSTGAIDQALEAGMTPEEIWEAVGDQSDRWDEGSADGVAEVLYAEVVARQSSESESDPRLASVTGTGLGDYLKTEEVEDGNWAYGTTDAEGVFESIEEGFTSEEEAISAAEAFRARQVNGNMRGGKPLMDAPDEPAPKKKKSKKKKASHNTRVPKGGLEPEFSTVSFTNRPSVYNQAYVDAGIDPGEAINLPIEEQFKILKKLYKEKFNVRVQKTPTALSKEAVDNLLDGYRNIQMMLHAIGLPLTALSHDGKLTLQLERDEGRYLGAYSPGERAILMPGRSNSFAHEWMHSFDHYLSDVLTGSDFDYLSRVVRREGVDFQPNSLEEAFVNLMNTIFFDKDLLQAASELLHHQLHGSPKEQEILAGFDPMEKNTKAAKEAKKALEEIRKGSSRLINAKSLYYRTSQKYKKDPTYWVDPAEMIARAFESYIATKVSDVGGTNEFITKGQWAYLKGQDRRMQMTFPRGNDRQHINNAFEELFAQLGADYSLGRHRPAARPKNEAIVDPARWDKWIDPGPQENIYKQIKRDATEWASEAKNHFKTAVKGNDNERNFGTRRRFYRELQTMFASITGMMQSIQNKYNSQALQQIINEVSTDPGSGKLRRSTFEEGVDQQYKRQMNRVTNILTSYGLKNMTEEERKMLRDVMVSARPPGDVPQNIMKAAGNLRALMDEEWYRNRNAGIRLGYTKNGYLQRMLDYDMVWNNPTKFKTQAGKVYKKQFMNEIGTDPYSPKFETEKFIEAAKNIYTDKYREAIDPYLETIESLQKKKAEAEENGADSAELDAIDQEIADNIKEIYNAVRDGYALEAAEAWESRIAIGSATDFDTKGPSGDYTLSRVLPPEADTLLADFLNTDPVDAISQYMLRSARRVEYTTRFGADGSKLESLLKQAGKEGVHPEDIRAVRKMIEVVTGKDGNETMPLKGILNFIHTMGTIALLPRAVYSSLAEPITAYGRTKDARELYLPFVQMVESIFKTSNAKQREEVAQAIGAVVNSRYDMLVLSRVSGDVPLGRRNERILGNFFQRNLLSPLTNAQRKSMVGTSHRFLLKATESALDGSNPEASTIARMELAELGIAAGEIRSFHEWLNQNDGALPTAEDIHGSEAGKLYSVATNRMIDQIIQNPKKVDRPALAGHPVLRMMYGIMSFQYAFWRNVHRAYARRIVRNAEVQGPLKAYGEGIAHAATFMTALWAGQFMVTVMREALFNGEKWEEKEEEGELMPWLLSLSFSRTGLTGVADPAVQLMTGLKYERDLTNALAGAQLGFFLTQAGTIGKMVVGRNSENTNTAEYNAAQATYRSMVQPALMYMLSITPGSTATNMLVAPAMHWLSSQQANKAFAEIVAGGPKGTKVNEPDPSYSDGDSSYGGYGEY